MWTRIAVFGTSLFWLFPAVAVAGPFVRVFLVEGGVITYNPSDSFRTYVHVTSSDDNQVAHRFEVANRNNFPGYTLNARRWAHSRSKKTLGPPAVAASEKLLWVDSLEVHPAEFRLGAQERVTKLETASLISGKMQWINESGEPAKQFPFDGVVWVNSKAPLDRWELVAENEVRVWLGLIARSTTVAIRFELSETWDGEAYAGRRQLSVGRIEPKVQKDGTSAGHFVLLGKTAAPFAEGFEAIEAGGSYVFVTHSGKAYRARRGDRTDNIEGKVEQIQFDGDIVAVVTVMGKRQRSFVMVRKDNKSAVCNEVDAEGKFAPTTGPAVALVGDDAEDLSAIVDAAKRAAKPAEK